MFINIKKISQINNALYYKVNTLDLGGYEFYLKIFPEVKEVLIYLSDNFNEVNKLGSLSFDNLKEFTEIVTIHPKVLGMVFYKIKKAIDDNYFPDQLNYISC